MTEEIKRKFDRDMKLRYDLDFIKQCCEVAAKYLEGGYEVNDLEELIFDLENMNIYVNEIDSLIEEMAIEYETKIEELKNEQL